MTVVNISRQNIDNPEVYYLVHMSHHYDYKEKTPIQMAGWLCLMALFSTQTGYIMRLK